MLRDVSIGDDARRPNAFCQRFLIDHFAVGLEKKQQHLKETFRKRNDLRAPEQNAPERIEMEVSEEIGCRRSR